MEDVCIGLVVQQYIVGSKLAIFASCHGQGVAESRYSKRDGDDLAFLYQLLAPIAKWTLVGPVVPSTYEALHLFLARSSG